MLATMKDAVQEYALWVGRDKPYTQWILSDYDSWEKNPHYVGPDQGHPESDEEPICAVYGTIKEARACAKNYAYGLNKTILVEHYKNVCWVVWF